MANPSIRPMPKPRTGLSPEQLLTYEKATSRTNALTNQMINSMIIRQNWMTHPRTMQRIENTLANDPELRNLLFATYKGSNTPFVAFNPKEQLRITKNVRSDMREIARNAALVATTQSLIPNPNDPLNLYNQANPNNLINQQQAAQQANIQAQGNIANQTNLHEDMDFTNNQQQQIITAENIQEQSDIELSEQEEQEITDYNTQTYGNTLTPQPGSNAENKKDPVLHEAKKDLEHRGEGEALRSYIKSDRHGMIEGFKGKMEKEAEHEVEEHMVMAAVKVLSAGA